MTDNTIKLKPVGQMGGSLLPGELVIDEAGRKLYLDDGVHGPQPIPLDFGAIPAKPKPADPSAILVLGAGGPEWDVLQSTGGGPAISDVPGWFVPGAFFSRGFQTVHVTANSLATAITAPFELTEDVSIRRLLVIPAAANVIYHFGIARVDGTVLATFSANGNAGWQQQMLDLPLSTGRYLTFLYAASALDFQSLGYSHPWQASAGDVEHMVLLRLN
jgi:hypothetical protein